MIDIKNKAKNIFNSLKDEFGYTNLYQAPKLEKIIISVGAGRDKDDKRKMAVILDRLEKITGQKASPSPAKKSIASFKLREGQIIGYKATLRGDKMYRFLDKFISIVIPRMKDFRGVKISAVDEMGNLSIGIKEHIVFPETGDEEIKDIFGLSIVVVSTAKNKKEGVALFTQLGVPFEKENNNK